MMIKCVCVVAPLRLQECASVVENELRKTDKDGRSWMPLAVELPEEDSCTLLLLFDRAVVKLGIFTLLTVPLPSLLLLYMDRKLGQHLLFCVSYHFLLLLILLPFLLLHVGMSDWKRRPLNDTLLPIILISRGRLSNLVCRPLFFCFIPIKGVELSRVPWFSSVSSIAIYL